MLGILLNIFFSWDLRIALKPQTVLYRERNGHNNLYANVFMTENN